MNRVKQILIYILIIIIALTCFVVVWHYFRNQIILGLGWVALFALVFGAGVIVGQLSARKASATKPQIEKSDAE